MARVFWDGGRQAPVTAVAREALLAALDEGWADPHRLHREGRRARMLLDGAREAVAAVLGRRTEEVAFTGSFATAAHAAVLGTVRGRRRHADLFVHSAIEHSTVLAAADWHVGTGGRSAGVAVDRDGRVNQQALAQAVADPSVAAVAVQAANGEVGTCQPLAELLADLPSARPPVICDVSAALGHVDLPAADLVDVLFADPTGWGAPPGLGVLAVRAGVRWVSPWPADPAVPPDGCGAPGGGAVPLALAAAVGLQHAVAGRQAADVRRRAAIDRLRQRIPQLVPDVEVVGDPTHRLPHVLTFSVLWADGEALVDGLDRAGFAVGSGSACTAATLRPSHVLAAMGVLTHGNIRIALPHDIPAGVLDAQAERFLRVLPGVVADVRARLGAAGL